MSPETKLPLALYKANLELLLRIGALLHENRRRWAGIGLGSSQEAMQHTLQLTERMLTANDWASLAALPGEEFWRSLGAAHAVADIPVEQLTRSQSEFAEGLKLALAQWQQQAADAMAASLPTAPAESIKPGKQGKPASSAARSPRSSGPRAVPAKNPASKAPARRKPVARTPRKR